jgi:hypothetical protein
MRVGKANTARGCHLEGPVYLRCRRIWEDPHCPMIRFQRVLARAYLTAAAQTAFLRIPLRYGQALRRFRSEGLTVFPRILHQCALV